MSKLIERLRSVPRILSALNRRMGRPLGSHDLEDLQQNVVLVVLRKLDALTARRHFESWLYKVCYLEYMNGVRGSRRRMMSLVEDPAGPSPNTGDLLGDEALMRALDRIGGIVAETIRLKHFDGLTFEEIARRHETSESTVKARYYRALRKMAVALADRSRRGRTA